MAIERVLDLKGGQRLGVRAYADLDSIRVRIYNEDGSVQFEGMFSPDGRADIEYRFDTIDFYEVNQA